MNIGILGGSFDPPHIGHLLVARQIKEIAGFDQIWLMPYFDHNWDSPETEAYHRLAMAKCIEEVGIVVSDVEIKQNTKSYTIDTVRRLKIDYPKDIFSWIVGSDVLQDFHRWREFDQLTKEIKFLLLPRDGYPIPLILPEGFKSVSSDNLVTTNLSSSIIRNRVTLGLSVKDMVPAHVLSYIHEHRLYRS